MTSIGLGSNVMSIEWNNRKSSSCLFAIVVTYFLICVENQIRILQTCISAYKISVIVQKYSRGKSDCRTIILACKTIPHPALGTSRSVNKNNDTSSKFYAIRLNKRQVRRNANTVLRRSSPAALPRPSILLSLSCLLLLPLPPPSSPSSLRRESRSPPDVPASGSHSGNATSLSSLETKSHHRRRVAPWRRDLETTRLLVSRASTNSLTALTIEIPRGRRHCRCR